MTSAGSKLAEIRWTAPEAATAAWVALPGFRARLASVSPSTDIYQLAVDAVRPFLANQANAAMAAVALLIQALITEVEIPKLDGSSKDPAYLDVTWDSPQAGSTLADRLRYWLLKKKSGPRRFSRGLRF